MSMENPPSDAPLILPEPKSVRWGDGFLPWERAEFKIGVDGMPMGEFLSVEFAGMPRRKPTIFRFPKSG